MKNVGISIGIFGLGCLLVAIYMQLKYGVFYDTRHTEAMQYRVTGDNVEIMVHGEWVAPPLYEVKHLGFHIDQRLKRAKQ